MRLRFEPFGPWTRDHEKFVHAFAALQHANVRAGAGCCPDSMANWLHRNYGLRLVRRLTTSQARAARRRLNAWRAGIEGRVDYIFVREYPRQARRNYRRKLLRTLPPASRDGEFLAFQRDLDRRVAAVLGARVPARITAITPGAEFENLIRGTALECLGGLVPSESRRRNP